MGTAILVLLHCVVTGAVPEQHWMISYRGLEKEAKLLSVPLLLYFVCLLGLKKWLILYS